MNVHSAISKSINYLYLSILDYLQIGQSLKYIVIVVRSSKYLVLMDRALLHECMFSMYLLVINT